MMPQLGIRTRFTLILSLIFVVTIAAAWIIFSRVVQQQAEDEITYQASVLIAMLNSVRTYTNTEVENEHLKLFPTGFQKKVIFDNELKTLHFKYIGEQSQCTNVEEFEKQTEEEGGGTGAYKGKLIEEVVNGNLSWE